MSKWELNIHGKTRFFEGPQVMGIVNVTPDSFWEGSRLSCDVDLIKKRVQQILSEGGTMIDVGAYSTRPGAPEVTAEVELERLSLALKVIRAEVGEYPLVSVDTFRADVAEMCVRQLGADIINDISGGTLDERMLPVVAETGAPYILMHMRGTPQTMQTLTDYPEGVTRSVVTFFEQQLAALQQECSKTCEKSGKELSLVPQVILDPGYGFAKTLEQNYELLRELPTLMAAFPDYPMLVGISRKSMIYRLLGTDPSKALNGTTVLNTFAVSCGAHILRVHDVREAVEAVQILSKLNSNN